MQSAAIQPFYILSVMAATRLLTELNMRRVNFTVYTRSIDPWLKLQKQDYFTFTSNETSFVFWTHWRWLLVRTWRRLRTDRTHSHLGPFSLLAHFLLRTQDVKVCLSESRSGTSQRMLDRKTKGQKPIQNSGSSRCIQVTEHRWWILSPPSPTPAVSPADIGLEWLREPGWEALVNGRLGLDVSSSHARRYSAKHMGSSGSPSSHLSPQVTREKHWYKECLLACP